MQDSIRTELKSHLLNVVNDQYNADCTNFDELHFHAFNEDYYIIGSYQAGQWLEKHDIDAFEAIEKNIEWERDNFGEVNLKPEDMNAEKVVNLYVYCIGYDLMSDLYIDLSDTTKAELIKSIENL